jgi:hypothetical protein
MPRQQSWFGQHCSMLPKDAPEDGGSADIAIPWHCMAGFAG